MRALVLSAILVAVEGVAVQTSFGALRGRTLANDVDQYLGVPFATARRFGDPVDWNTSWDQPRDALQAMPGCGPDSVAYGGFAEDCLYLNIWRAPAKKTQPILFWIYGGSFVSGEGSQYNSSVLASKHDALYVTSNYRLGVLGWLAVTDCSSDTSCHANFGLKDQQSALRWVNREAVAFGGDVSRFLVYGESAGAISIMMHLVAPGSRGLFTRALSESGATFAAEPAEAANMTQIFASALGCVMGDLQCLRGHSLEDVMMAATVAAPKGNPFILPSWGPVVDGQTIPADPKLLFQQGHFNRDVEVLAGSNTNEGSAFAFSSVEGNATIEDYKKFVVQVYGKGKPVPDRVVDKVLEMYPASSEGGTANRVMASDFLGDRGFICPSKQVVQLVSTFSNKRAFRYRFNYVEQDDMSPKEMGVQHGAEVPFVFDAAGFPDWDVRWTPTEEAFSEQLGAAWVAFANTGAPSAAWPTYVNATDLEPVLSPGAWPAEGSWRAEFCDFWETLCDDHFCDPDASVAV